PHAYIFQLDAIAQSRAEEQQKELLVFAAQIERARDEFLQGLIKDRDRLVTLLAIGFHTQGDGCRNSLSIRVGGKKPRRERRNLCGTNPARAIAAGNRDRRRAQSRARGQQVIDLCRRNEKQWGAVFGARAVAQRHARASERRWQRRGGRG